jgi:chromosome segregation ATPase
MAEENQKLAKRDAHVEQEMINVPYKVTTTASTTLVTDDCNIQLEYIKAMIDTLAGGIEVLNDDLQRLNDESLQQSQLIETTDQDLAMLKTSCEESNANLDGLNTNMIILEQHCSSLKQKVEESQSISYDGTLIWKITNVQEKMSKDINFLTCSINYR